MRLLKWLDRLCVLVCQVLLGTIVISVMIDVTLRYVVRRGFLASGEFVPYLFTWMVFIGATVAVRHKEHLAVDFVVSNLAGAARKWLEMAIRVVELGFFGVLTYYGWVMAMGTMVQRTPYLQIPYGWVYLSVPVSGVIMFAYTLEHLVTAYKQKTPDFNATLVKGMD